MTELVDGLADRLPGMATLYRALHAHPELAGHEHGTARTAAGWLRRDGWSVTEGVGGTGVVAVLRNGSGPTVLLRAELDGLPVAETTGLRYASTETAELDGRTVAVMHSCGHDVHLTCLLGACSLLAANRAAWSGTVVAVCQPAEETGTGAQAMLDDGLLDRFPRPDICLAQHVGPLPVGVVATRPGAVMAAADSVAIRLFGRGGHGSAPEQTIDPVVMAAAVVSRLQTIVAREIGAAQPAVVTVGSIHAGTGANVIPDVADLAVNLRSVSPSVRERLLDAVRRIVCAEAAASGAPRTPEFTVDGGFPLTVNDTTATERVTSALRAAGAEVHLLPAALLASEDFGRFGTAADCPSVFWHFGGDDSYTVTELAKLPEDGVPARIPQNHSGGFAPAVEPTLRTGTTALLAAAAAWL